MRERTIYECEHCCKKRLFVKKKMQQHEEKCWYNPANKTCMTCKFGDINYIFEDDKTVRTCLNGKHEFLESIRPSENCEFYKQKEPQ